MSNETTNNGQSWPADQQNLTHYLDGRLVPTQAPVVGAGTLNAQGTGQVGFHIIAYHDSSVRIMTYTWNIKTLKRTHQVLEAQEVQAELEEREQPQRQEELRIHPIWIYHQLQHQLDLVDLAWLQCRILFDPSLHWLCIQSLHSEHKWSNIERVILTSLWIQEAKFQSVSMSLLQITDLLTCFLTKYQARELRTFSRHPNNWF